MIANGDRSMNRSDHRKTVKALDDAYRNLALLTLEQTTGTSVTRGFSDILPSDSLLLSQSTIDQLSNMVTSQTSVAERDLQERILYACKDLIVESRNSSLSDMFKFYMDKGRMVVQGAKIPATEIVPWLQTQDEFDLREEMRKEIGIFCRVILNPILLSILDVTTRTVKETFGFHNFADYVEKKRDSSFQEWADIFINFLCETDELYFMKARSWAEQRLGRTIEELNRCHALRLMRIDDFDSCFPTSSLIENVQGAFLGLGLDLTKRKDIIIDIEDRHEKSFDALCIPVDLPGKIFVVMRPIGGLMDLETLLHEMGHAFFLSGFSAELPIEHKRFYRSAALDEAFAFLFAQLVENPVWLTDVAGVPITQADTLADLSRTKRLLLIRRHIGKFLAEKDLFEIGPFKDSSHYCKWLSRSTGFNYEPDGYLIDMDRDFYSAEYVWAWGGAEVMRNFLENTFGANWFQKREAGDFLGKICLEGRKNSLDQALIKFCGTKAVLPRFS
jgi:hypothetical protein